MNSKRCSTLTKSATLLLLLLAGCKGAPPAIKAKLWAGDSPAASITRAQDNESIACKDPLFDQYVCLSYVDLRGIYEVIQKCKKWDTRLMNEKEMEFWLKDPIVREHLVNGIKGD